MDPVAVQAKAIPPMVLLVRGLDEFGFEARPPDVSRVLKGELNRFEDILLFLPVAASAAVWWLIVRFYKTS